jgi:hypothetical protein
LQFNSLQSTTPAGKQSKTAGDESNRLLADAQTGHSQINIPQIETPQPAPSANQPGATAQPTLSAPEPAALQPSVASEDSGALLKPSLAFGAKITANAANTAAAPDSPMQTSPAGNQSQADAGDSNPASPQKQPVKATTKAELTEASQIADPTALSLPPAISTDTAFTLLPRQVATTDTPVAATKEESAPVNQPTDERPAAAALPDTSASPKSEPLRDLSLRIGTSPTNQVEVKLQERAGELHVAVLSSSPALTTDLRQQVGDLVGKLDRAGYHAETFGASPSLASKQSDSQSGAGQQQEPSGRQQPQDQQQNPGGRKRPNQPQWLQEMNTSFGPTAAEGIEQQ